MSNANSHDFNEQDLDYQDPYPLNNNGNFEEEEVGRINALVVVLFAMFFLPGLPLYLASKNHISKQLGYLFAAVLLGLMLWCIFASLDAMSSQIEQSIFPAGTGLPTG